MLGSLKKLFCCQRKNPQWLSHLLYECNQKKGTSSWCSVFFDNYKYLTEYDEKVVKKIHDCFESRRSAQSVLDAIRQDINKSNVLKATVGLFSSYIRMQYADTINPTQITINKIKSDYEEFSVVFKDCLVLFYDLDHLDGLFDDDNFCKKGLMNIGIELLFDNDDFYDTITQLQRKIDKQCNDKIQFNMQKFENLVPQEYGIAPQYCLDKETLKINGIESEVEEKPYNLSIKSVREIVKQRYPSEKLRKVQSVISLIEQSISNFYSQYKIKEKEALNADSLISILVYIIVQSKQGNLVSHLKLIGNYINKSDLTSGMNYSLSSIEACLQFIEKGNIRRSNGVKVSESELSLWLSLQNYFEQITSVDL